MRPVKPPLQRFGDAVLVQTAPALAEVRHTLALGARTRERSDGIPPSSGMRHLLALLSEAIAEATLTADVRSVGHAEVRCEAEMSQSNGWVDAATAARMLELTDRQTRRLAPHLGGHLVKGKWRFDRAAVVAEVQHRQKEADG